jgi:hypothetical protein
VFENRVAKFSANKVARIGANYQPCCETLPWRLWRKTNVKAGKPEIEHRVQAGCQHVVLHQQSKDPQEFGHIEEDTDGVAGDNKFEEIDEKQSSTPATLSSPSGPGTSSRSRRVTRTLTHCPTVPEIIATKPEQDQGQV